MSDNPFRIAVNKGRYIFVDSTDVEIQDGHFFKINEKVVDLADASTYTLHIKTGSDFAYIQQVKAALSDGPIDIVVTEAPTITDGSTSPDNVNNLNRDSTLTPDASFFTDSSSISGGTELETHFVPTGKDTAYTLSDDNHWVMKPNTDYIVQFVNNSGQLLTFSYTVIYHEHNGE